MKILSVFGNAYRLLVSQIVLRQSLVSPGVRTDQSSHTHRSIAARTEQLSHAQTTRRTHRPIVARTDQSSHAQTNRRPHAHMHPRTHVLPPTYTSTPPCPSERAVELGRHAAITASLSAVNNTHTPTRQRAPTHARGPR